jgi:hypothetical protein
MRLVSLFFSTLALGALVAAAPAAAASLDGAWSGSGIAKIRHRTDRLVCRVSFTRIEQTSYRVAAQCSAGDRRFEQTGRISSVGGNRYRGYVYNAQFNERGNLSLTQRGSSLAVSVSGGRGTATLTLSRR